MLSVAPWEICPVENHWSTRQRPRYRGSRGPGTLDTTTFLKVSKRPLVRALARARPEMRRSGSSSTTAPTSASLVWAKCCLVASAARWVACSRSSGSAMSARSQT
ncbi:Uncharacterised protein [Mycobacterium tuberculosis]|uniref:Uncharacterized protein n=1 Tax=Mycobacterium tuberculosis TaxID=1773 RepID=A0A654U5X3_MYCTX|nr:Uncharacterised protein [Mycobacterium tuberculosis]CKR01499.1 Uncharacterised protein [Mycobacterium tuberculosis]CKR93442.1 Uncharacterised protein [Mycobacterium tuberculosis]CKU06455.1 Uncharacterised protein [Mycobacterium tuberculosis]CKX11505.1 Uncharacterised protein [Mycobacterium tuberculosis]